MAFTPATACCKPSLVLAPRAASSRGSAARAQAALLCTPSTSAFCGLRAPASAAPAPPRWRRSAASTGIVCGKVSKGNVPPNFTLKDQNGKPVSLNKFKGKPVVVYFYPADETPGCTKQACAFRDSYEKFKKAGAEVIGISGDDAASHKAFAQKYRLPFTLLSDDGNRVRKEWGVPADLFGTLPGRFEEDPLTSEVGISSPALADGLVETKQPNDIPAINGGTTCSGSSDTPCLNHDQSVLVESLDVPDWATSFPGYFEDCGPVATYNHVDDIGSPVHEYLPRKGVPIGPEHQADIPEWRPRTSMIVPGASEFCADLDCSYASTSESVPTGDDKWIRYCVVPMTSCSSLVDWAGHNKIDCNCSDEGSMRCSRQHIIEARDSLKMSLGQDKFCELGLCEMGEDVAQRWTDEEEKLFQRFVFLNPVSLGKNFWDHLPDAFPGKTSQELVSYYFNVFMLRKRAQQNRSDVLRVDSDDDELHGLPLVEQEEGDPAVESSIHEHFVSNSLTMDDDHKEFEGAQFDGSLCEKSVYSAVECRHLPNKMPADSNTVNTAQDVYDQDRAQYAEFHMSLPNDTSNNLGDQSASV